MMTTRIAIAFVGAGLLAAGSAQAGITPISAPPVGEKTHEEILEDIFGGDFVQSGDSFSNGSVLVTRVDDDNDQTYDFLSWSAEAQATWAGASQAFGTASGGQAFAVTGDDNVVSGSTAGQAGGTLNFVRFGNEMGTLEVSTDSTANPNGADHVVTYAVTTILQQQNDLQDSVQVIDSELEARQQTYLLFFEDSNETSNFTDWDYNDLVVELVGFEPGQNVPEPGSLALIGLGSLAMLRRRRA